MFDFGFADVIFGLYPAEVRINFRDGRYGYYRCFWNRHAGRTQGDWELCHVTWLKVRQVLGI
jgi:hypothetical protein